LDTCGEVNVVHFGQVWDWGAGSDRPTLGCRIVGLRSDDRVGVEGCAARVNVGLEDFGEAWCYAAAAAGVS